MAKTDAKRKLRYVELQKYLKLNPLATDDELSKVLKVSINTIRLDRKALGIKEARDRASMLAKTKMEQITTLSMDEFVGELIDFVPGKNAISKFEAKKSMAFDNISVIKGEYIYSLAETLAISLIPASAALVGVANIKYFESIHISDIVYAHATVIRKIHSDYVVWVRITDNIDENVGKLKFKGKFILKGIE